jgi:TonB family protein
LHRYPKLIDPEILAYTADDKFSFSKKAELPSRSHNKEFLYFLALATSLAFMALVMLISSVPQEAVKDLASFLESIPFLDIKISQDIFKELRFPNPVTSSLFIACFSFWTFMFFDLSRKNNLEASFLRKVYDTNGKMRFEFSNSKEHLSESSSMSFILHVLVLLAIITSVLFTGYPKPKVQVSTIEFIPSQIETKEKVPEKVKKKSDKNSRDQGKHDPTKPIKPPTPSSGTPKQQSKSQTKTSPKPQALPKPAPASAPKMSDPKPSAGPVPVATPKSFKPQPKQFNNAFEKTQATNSNTLPSPLNYAMNTSTGSGSRSSSTGRPAPISGDGSSSSPGNDIVSRFGSIPRAPDSIGGGSGGSGGLGTAGNPPPNPYGDRDPSIASRADFNFGPYMSNLQRKIKRAWRPPTGTESNKIKVSFTVLSDGTLTNLKLVQASADQSANQAALQAVSAAAPFDPLPPGSAPTVDIDFTFDYNVFQKQRW